jgi:F0F1-type ATP synthase membrane subunit b/b'
MSKRKNRVALIAIPITFAVATTSFFISFFLKKKETIPENVKEVAKNAVKDIESTALELKEAIENKNTNQLERNIDNAVESAKTRIDKMAAQIKNQLKSFEIHGSSPLNTKTA